MFIKAVFEATLGLTNILEITFNTLNQVNHVRCITSDVRFDLIHLASAIKICIDCGHVRCKDTLYNYLYCREKSRGGAGSC